MRTEPRVRRSRATDVVPHRHSWPVEDAAPDDGLVRGNACTAAGLRVACGPEPVLVAGATLTWTITVRLDVG